jgi:hypothetical protein
LKNTSCLHRTVSYKSCEWSIIPTLWLWRTVSMKLKTMRFF